MRKDNNMKNFTKKDLKPNMILRLNNDYADKGYIDLYYVGSDVLVAEPSNWKYFNLNSFTDDICDENFYLLAVYKPNPNDPFNVNKYSMIWSKYERDTMVRTIKADDGEFTFNPICYSSSGNKYGLIYVRIKNSITKHIAGMFMSLDNMKQIRDDFTKIIDYVEDNNE